MLRPPQGSSQPPAAAAHLSSQLILPCQQSSAQVVNASLHTQQHRCRRTAVHPNRHRLLSKQMRVLDEQERSKHQQFTDELNHQQAMQATDRSPPIARWLPQHLAGCPPPGSAQSGGWWLPPGRAMCTCMPVHGNENPSNQAPRPAVQCLSPPCSLQNHLSPRMGQRKCAQLCQIKKAVDLHSPQVVPPGNGWRPRHSLVRISRAQPLASQADQRQGRLEAL